jgi:pyruvate-formate lyase-activating enzyme
VGALDNGSPGHHAGSRRAVDGIDRLVEELRGSGVRRLGWMFGIPGRRPAGPDARRRIVRRFRKDRLLLNYNLSLWEHATGQTRLDSHPWRVTIPVSTCCDARCCFCSSWFQGGGGFFDPSRIAELAEVLRYAKLVGLVGYGEPLLHPDLPGLLRECRRYTDRRASFFVVTNGKRLPRLLDTLLAAKVKSYNVSLNAATAETHQRIMALGPGTFDEVVRSVARLTAARGKDREIHVSLSLVVCAENLHEVVPFIGLANQLNVSRIVLRSLLPRHAESFTPGVNYPYLAPRLVPGFAEHVARIRRAMEGSVVPVEAVPDSWGGPVVDRATEERVAQGRYVKRSREELIAHRAPAPVVQRGEEGKGQGRRLDDAGQDPLHAEETRPDPAITRSAPLPCGYVYYTMMVEDSNLRTVPCCNLGRVPGHEEIHLGGGRDPTELWNSPAMEHLRGVLRTGPLYRTCGLCQDRGLT